MLTLALLVLALSGCGGSTHTVTVAKLPALHPHRAGPESMFTDAAELMNNPTAELNELKTLGVDRIHIYMHWADIAPDATSRHMPTFDATQPGDYPPSGWAQYDAVIRDAAARHIGVDLALVPPPPVWAAGPGAPNPAKHPWWEPSAPEYGQWVAAVATRYSGTYVPDGSTHPLPRVDFWSIWNEPNLGFQLAPQAIDHSRVDVSGRLYRGLVNAAWSALQQTGHGHDTILIGETGPAGETNGSGPGLFNSMAPLRFLRDLYCVDANYHPLRGTQAAQLGCPTSAAASDHFAAANPGLFHASGFADHPYSQGLPPNEATPDEPDFAELAGIPSLERTLDSLQHVYGSSTRFPIWSTEFGYQTTPPDTESGTVSPTLAAYYLNWSEYLTWLDPRQRSYDQYQLLDGPAGVFATGLRTATGVPLPGFFAYRMPLYLPVTDTRLHHPLVVWGCVRPAPGAADATHHRQQVEIQFAPHSGGAFRTVQTVALTGPHGYFEVLHTFSGSGSVRLAWSYPHGPEIYSRTQTITLGS